MSDPQAEERIGDPRALLESSSRQLERIIAVVCRRLCLGADDAEEFRSWAYLKLIDNDYRIFRQYSGRSQLQTFLMVVVQHLAVDFRNERWGRFRNSAEATRRGLEAMQLETLLVRDELSFDEAVQTLRSQQPVRLSDAELAELAAGLPQRRRRRWEGEEVVESLESRFHADDKTIDADRQATLERTQEALQECLRQLGVKDRLMLKMLYESGLTVTAAAATLGETQRAAYTRHDRCRRELRRHLENRGLNGQEVLDAVGWKESNLKIDYQLDKSRNMRPCEKTRPSKETEDE